ncbi:MAG: type II secretion system protein [Elusimicrobiota bacterium]
MALNAKGYTLTEVMIAVAILGLMTAATSRLLTTTFRVWKLDQTRLETQRDARTALNLVQSLLREASADGILLTRLSAAEPPYSKIEFSDADGRVHRFYQQENSLIMQRYDVFLGTHTRSLTDDLRYAAFAYPDTTKDNLLSVALCLEKEAYWGEKRDFYLSVQRVQVGNP